MLSLTIWSVPQLRCRRDFGTQISEESKNSVEWLGLPSARLSAETSTSRRAQGISLGFSQIGFCLIWPFQRYDQPTGRCRWRVPAGWIGSYSSVASCSKSSDDIYQGTVRNNCPYLPGVAKYHIGTARMIVKKVCYIVNIVRDNDPAGVPRVVLRDFISLKHLGRHDS